MADTIETLKIEVITETQQAEAGLKKLNQTVDKLGTSLGAPTTKGKSSAGLDKGLNAATSALGGNLSSVTGMLSQLGPKGMIAAAVITACGAAMKGAADRANKLQGYMVDLAAKFSLGTTAMREFNAQLNDTARNSSVSQTDLGKFFSSTRTTFDDSSQMQRDSGFARDLIAYYGDVNKAVKAYETSLRMSAEEQARIRDYMAQSNSLIQDTGQKGLEGIKNNLGDMLASLGTIVFQLLNPFIQQIKMLSSIFAEVLSFVTEIFDVFSGVTGSGTVDKAMMNAAESAGDAADSVNALNKEIEEYNGKLSGLDEISTLGDESKGLAGTVDLSAVDSTISETANKMSIMTAPFGFMFDAVKGVIDLVKDVLLPILRPIKEFFNDIAEYLSGMLTEGGGLVSSVLEPIKNILEGMITPIVTILEPTLQVIFEVFRNVFVVVEALFEAVMLVVGGVLDLVDKAVAPLLDNSNGLMEIVGGVFEIVAEIIAIVTDVAAPILDVVIGLIKVIFAALSPIFEVVSKIANGPLKIVLDIIKQVVTWVKDKLVGAFDVLREFIEKIMTPIKGFFNMIIDGINFLIRGINKFSIKVPDWIPLIGGKSWGFNLSEVKYLAQGGEAYAGQLVNIRESGPELVSWNNNKMEVMNNDQIATAVGNGVAAALSNNAFGGNSQLFIDGYELNVRLQKSRQRAGTLNLGKPLRAGGY